MDDCAVMSTSNIAEKVIPKNLSHSMKKREIADCAAQRRSKNQEAYENFKVQQKLKNQDIKEQ